jgi:hypothetical protein
MLGKFTLQAVLRQVEQVTLGVGVVADDDHRRIAAEGADGAQPVLDAVLLVGVAHVQHQHIDAARREEERMGGVHEVLPAEVPEDGRCGRREEWRGSQRSGW